MKILTGLHAGRRVELVSALDRVVQVKILDARYPQVVPVAPTELEMSPIEWGALSNLGGTGNLTRWYGYDYPARKVVEVVAPDAV